MTLKRAIVLPVLISAAASLAAALAICGMALYASDRKDAILSAALEVTRRADRVGAGISDAEAYVQKVTTAPLLMPQSDVAPRLRHRLAAINRDLTALLKLPLPAALRREIMLLSETHDEWCTMAVVLIGILPAEEPATLEAVSLRGQAVLAQVHVVKSLAAGHAGTAIDTANQSLYQQFALGLAGIFLLFAIMVVFAARKAHAISAAMQTVTSRLQALASQETVSGRRPGDDLPAVFAALDTLSLSLREKKRIAERLQEEKARAEAATETKSRFLATMSHEIRTPINGVLGMAEVLHESGLTAEQRACTSTILASSEALLRIVNDILDFSRLEAGKTQMLEQRFHLREVIYDVATLMSPAATAKGVEICLDISGSGPGHFTGDSGRVRQILMNLVGNAVKFTLEGYVAITLTYDGSQQLPLRVRVEDSGVGIPHDRIGQIFRAFEQVESTTARRFDGSGLGLAISSRLARAMGGRIEAQSELGKGSCFTLCLPLPVAEGGAPEAAAVEAKPLLGQRTVVAADLAFTRGVRQRQMQDWGAETTVLPSLEALELHLRATAAEAQAPDLLLVEISLTAEAAAALCARIWALPGCAELPVVICASSQTVAAYQKLKAQGPVQVLMKPARTSALRAALTEAGRCVPCLLEQPEDAAPHPADFSGLRLLVAEDNRTNQLVLSKMLAPTGIRITFCADGQEAVGTFKAARFDLVFMDMSMPSMDGLQATRLIRDFERDEDRPPCPIVALTANVLSTDDAACRAAGMVDFLTKPVRRQELTETIRAWTSGRARGAESVGILETAGPAPP
ncbi:response regulator [Cribrihabitans neustonicus]|uniref:response regulator n=1 Tax=Cribrihabitans neustonicus TaxID=1429085 RepID=UPI003B5B144B